MGLGRAGLLPFLGGATLVYLDPERGALWGAVLASYALAILCFLPGIWWGLALIRRSGAAMALSNLFVLAAFFGHVMLETGPFLLLCAALFPATVLVERRHPLFGPQPAYYARLRAQLSAVATLALVLSAARLPGVEA